MERSAPVFRDHAELGLLYNFSNVNKKEFLLFEISFANNAFPVMRFPSQVLFRFVFCFCFFKVRSQNRERVDAYKDHNKLKA